MEQKRAALNATGSRMAITTRLASVQMKAVKTTNLP